MNIEYYFPKPIWQDETCYIIGGGSSLKEFDWNLLQGKNVLGCNAAFYIGAHIVPITIFGDGEFLKQHRNGLDNYAESGGQVITCSKGVRRFNHPDYVKIVKKQLRGIGTDSVAWNGNTGSIAINYALLLGAKKIYLLGYDMGLSEQGKKNYHNCYNDRPNPKTYKRFLRGLTSLARDLLQLFPSCEVINLEDNTSSLNSFSKESLKNHFFKVKEMVI